jgi:hypothetical protein
LITLVENAVKDGADAQMAIKGWLSAIRTALDAA